MNITRRDWLAMTLGAGATFAIDPRALLAQGKLITRGIPSSGEQLPVIGLGSSATFASVARSEDLSALREVFKALVDGGATVFDTAPGYGASEEASGRIAAELGLTDKIFWATKLNVAGRGGSSADPAKARAQVETSFSRIKKAKIDAIQVHNMGDVATQIQILREFKQQGRIRYIGLTTTFDQQYDDLVATMRKETLDFIGVDYAIDNREVETTILPLARDRGIGVFVYAPFGRTRLFKRVGDRPVPDRASEFDAKTWAQFFLKYVLSHPAVTVARVGTTKAHHMLDNIGGGIGRLPNEATRQRMAAFIDALPPLPPLPQNPAAAPGISLSAAILDRYVGEYTAASGFTATFRRDGDRLWVKPGGNPEAPLNARSETRFQDPRGPFFEFQLDGQGKVTGASMEQQGQQGPQRTPLERK
jgi:aryl-alcohol dehydrogenase-like predicted oxidoreductase